MHIAQQTGDAEPMAAAHEVSPFEEPAADAGYSSDAFAIEEPQGLHVASSPLAADLASPLPPPEEPVLEAPLAVDESEVFEPAEGGIAPGFIQGAFDANVPPPPPAVDDFAKTITMADLYAEQGLVDEARDIYEDILARDPDNAAVLERMQRLESAAQAPPAPVFEDEEPAPVEEEPAPVEEPPAPEPAMAAAAPADNAKIRKLESWLARVGKKEAGRV